MHQLPGSRRARRLPLGVLSAAGLLAAAAGCAKTSPVLLATGVYVTNVDAGTSVYASLDGGPAAFVQKSPLTLQNGVVSEHMFPANPGIHTFRVYISNLNVPSFECTFELPSGKVADFVYGRRGTPPEDQLRCPPTYRQAPPAD